MKLFKIAAITTAVLGSTMAMAMDNVQPYQYDANGNIITNTTGAVVSTGKTLFNTVTHPAAVSAEIGTLGYGANIAWGINKSVELQAGWSGMDFDGDTELNSDDSWINYEKALGDGYEEFKGDFKYDVDFSNPYLGVQMRPLNNWLTVGAGVMVPRNEFAASLTADANYTISDDNDVPFNYSPVTLDGTEYWVADGTTVDMKIENKNKLAPYATLGFRPNINNKWGGFIEAGAAYMGKVKSDVNVTNGSIEEVIEVNDTTITTLPGVEQFEREAEKELNDNDDLWYPIVKAGLTYRF